MSDTYSKSPKHATRAELEAQYLTALMRRDAHVFAERMLARDRLMSRDSVTRYNPQIEKAPRESPSIFEDSFTVLR